MARLISTTSLHVCYQRKLLGRDSSYVQPATLPQATKTSSNSSLPPPANKPSPWFGVPTRPGPGLEDGTDYHDFLGLNKLSHISGSLLAAVLFLALGAEAYPSLHLFTGRTRAAH